jgi:DNA-binding PadR family transcriptional regulator
MTAPNARLGERESLLLKGVVDMCVLALLAAKPNHAYGVVRQLQSHGFSQTSYGTVYPLVTRLRRQGLIQWEDSNRRVAAVLGQPWPGQSDEGNSDA